MAPSSLHRFEQGGRRYVVDTETCFCFECDDISWAVLDLYPHTPVNRIVHLVGQSHPPREVEEVIGELEWLRSTKSILPTLNQKDRLKQFEPDNALRRIDAWLPSGNHSQARRILSGAMALLLGRSGAQNALHLYLHAPDNATDWPAESIERAINDAALAGKSLRVNVVLDGEELAKTAKPLAGHALAVAVPLAAGEVGERLLALQKASAKSLAKVATLAPGVRTILTPGPQGLSDAVTHLRSAGFQDIEIDWPAAYQRDPGLDPQKVLAEMHKAAVFYAQQLHQGDYFRLEPIAATFHQIYEGKAQPRHDGSGSTEWAIDAEGNIYPSRYVVGQVQHQLGSLDGGKIDHARLAPFGDLGALTTSPCNQCWARNLCGGGHSAIHQALGGSIRTPSAAWCESQREWFASAIAAFNFLSAHGVNFARLYANLGKQTKLSLWQTAKAAKAAVTMKVNVRPIEEADAALLNKWENWSDAAYFLANEYGMFLATQYDREMDSLHPRGFEQELMITSRQGAPIGLLKIRPDTRLNLARVWVFFRNREHYSDPGIRKSFAQILSQTAAKEESARLVAAAGPGDQGLGDFLEAIGFQKAGAERQALFLHDAYHDIAVYHRMSA